MVLQMIGSRKTVPPRMLRMVPLGLSHIFLSLNSVMEERKGLGRVMCGFCCLKMGKNVNGRTGIDRKGAQNHKHHFCILERDF